MPKQTWAVIGLGWRCYGKDIIKLLGADPDN